MTCPWYPILGNHDWSKRQYVDFHNGGNGTAQIAYSAISNRWTMPDLFYVVDTYLPNGLSQRIIMIDTVMLSGLYATRPKDQPEEGTPDDREYSDKMFEWIEDRITESDDFDFLFIAGLDFKFH